MVCVPHLTAPISLQLGRAFTGQLQCRARRTPTGHMATSPREDPSRLTKEELSTRGAETVAAVGAIARLVAKQAVSAPLQATISTFADYEKTVVSTEDMLRKTMKGMSDMSDALDEISSSMQG